MATKDSAHAIAVLQADLDRAESAFDAAVGAVAEQVRTGLVLPACRKHRLRFVSGMGDFWFAKGDDQFSGPQHPDFSRLSRAARASLIPIFNLLNREVSHNQYLGYWVRDVDPAKELA